MEEPSKTPDKFINNEDLTLSIKKDKYKGSINEVRNINKSKHM